jgi:cysteine desulfuration protein SufE
LAPAACRENRRAEDSARLRDRLSEAATPEAALRTLDAIREDFAFLDDWEDRYRYVIELGRELEVFPDSARTDANKVRGCVSQVWIENRVENGVMRLQGDSDSHLVRGLVAIAASLYDGKTPQEVLKVDARAVFGELGLEAHLTPQRSNGVRSMIDRIRADAASFAA